MAAQIALAVLWFAWLYPFAFRAPHHQNRENITVAGPTRVGLLLECIAIAMAFAFRLPPQPASAWYRLLPAILLASAAIPGAWASVTHLGKQFRLHAGLYVDHQLIQTGPYAIVRHPIYATFLAMLLCSLLLMTPWPWALASLSVFLIGTEIRVRSEDRLLESRFGDEFRRYRRRVSAYVPFVR